MKSIFVSLVQIFQTSTLDHCIVVSIVIFRTENEILLFLLKMSDIVFDLTITLQYVCGLGRGIKMEIIDNTAIQKKVQIVCTAFTIRKRSKTIRHLDVIRFHLDEPSDNRRRSNSNDQKYHFERHSRHPKRFVYRR